MKNITLLIIILFVFTSCATLNRAHGELQFHKNTTKGQELLDLKKALDEGALTSTEYELIKQRIIDDYYVEKLIKEEISLGKKNKKNKKAGNIIMKKITTIISLFAVMSFSYANDKDEITKEIVKAIDYLNKNNSTYNNYSSDGALEFWSSGGLLNYIPSTGPNINYELVNMKTKHIEVVVLVPKKAAVAMYYMEGSMKPEGSNWDVSNYLTRVSQTFAKEKGKWVVKTSHFSPVQGGQGTTATSTKE